MTVLSLTTVYLWVTKNVPAAALALGMWFAKSPLPEGFFRAMLSKGARTMADTTLVSNLFADLKVAAKVAADALPGDTAEAKAEAVLNLLEPAFNEALTALNVSPLLDKVSDALFEAVVKAEVKAILAS